MSFLQAARNDLVLKSLISIHSYIPIHIYTHIHLFNYMEVQDMKKKVLKEFKHFPNLSVCQYSQLSTLPLYFVLKIHL